MVGVSITLCHVKLWRAVSMWNVSSGRGMAAMIAAVIALGSGCAGSRAGTGATSEAQGSARQPFPMLLTARRAWTGENRAAKIRMWADQEYRAQNPRWQEDLDDYVAYANRVLIPMLGVGLAAEYRAWDHRAQGGDLAAELAALVRTDPGDDVVWVVGVTAGVGDSTSFERLGGAQLGHVVVRGDSEREQRNALERAFPEASPDERANAPITRRRHQTTVVLLHQLAHSLGALHESEPDRIMSASYSPAVEASIGEGNRRRMLSALDERLAAAKHYREAERLFAGGDAARAAVALAPVLRLYPARVRPRVLRCRIELAQGGAQNAGAIAACDEAAATAVESAVVVATARRGAGDVTGAQRTLVAAEDHLAGVAPDEAAAAWLAIAREYRELGALTRAENAVAKAGPGAADHGIAAWAASTRVRYGIPRDGIRWNLPLDDEAAAVAAVRNAVALVNASEWDTATKAIDDAERRWPTLPGVLTARCALEFRRDAIAAARRLCERAIAQGESSWALYLLGTMELEAPRGSAATGTKHLREAIAQDPDLVQAWRKLARALEKARATAELEQLRRDYRARFGAALPD
jgi:tetratricopeptide (TPR) repeat protein